MYAIVQVGSAQFKIKEGDTIDASRLAEEEGKNITIDQVLLYSNGEDIRVGQPFLKDVKVTAKVLAHKLDDRRLAFKFRRRKGYSRKVGHRPHLTSLNITKISA
jgi:large subunit ribosomal protein L21